MSKPLLHPAVKLFIAQLNDCKQTAQVNTESNPHEWMCHALPNCTGIGFSQVWIQGYVVQVFGKGNDVLLDDGTGILHATGITRLFKNMTISKGMYVMVAGQLKPPTQLNPYPVIRVLKIGDLSRNLSAETMWFLEVIDVQKNIYAGGC